MVGRRTLLQGALAGTAALVLPDRLWASTGGSPMYHQWKPVRDKHVLVAAGVSGNMVLVLGKSGRGSLLIDGQTAPFGGQIRREAEELGKKVELMVSTHHHPDITGGNHAFTTDTRVLGHAKCKERIPGQMNRYISQIKEFLLQEKDSSRAKAMAAIQADWQALHKRFTALKPEQFAPTEVLDGERQELEVGGRKVVLMAAGSGGAHTDNDVVVHLPDDDVLIAGGLAAPQVHAVIDGDGGANTAGWQKALEKLEALAGPKTVVVPSEGKAGDRSMLVWQREYLHDLRAAVELAVRAGRGRAEVRGLRPKLRVRAGTPDTRMEASLDAVYDEVKAEGEKK